MSSKKTYEINFGVEAKTPEEDNNQQNKAKEEIGGNNVKIEGFFEFYDYNLNATIGYLKEFFLTTFGRKYPYCKCVLFVYYKISATFGPSKYHLLSDSDEKKLKEFNHNKLYLIKIDHLCDCEYKTYTKYMNMKKFEILADLKNLDIENKKNEEEIDKLTKIKYEQETEIKALNEEIQKLKDENSSLKKDTELKIHNDLKFEKFYDIVININSIKNVSNEGWKINFNEEGLKKYNTYKDNDLITIGVIGNNNKGKSFLLSKISKFNLPTGTSINTEGLSVKYPDLKGYEGRQIIFLDSAGLEMPVLRKNNKEKIKNNVNNENQKPDENKINDEQNNEVKSNDNKNIQKESDEKQKEKKISQYEDFKENAKDKIVTELFLEHFIIKVSDILLLVVGKLTYSEQLLINKIKVESQRQNKGRIFIVHNLQEFRLVDQVEKYIKEYLLKCSTFDLKKRNWISAEKTEANKKEDEINENEIKIDDNIREENKDNNNKDNQENAKEKNQDNIDDENEIIKLEDNENPKNDNQNKKIEEVDINPEQKNNKDIEDQNVKEESKLNNIHFTEIINYGDKKKLEVYHLIIANEDSKAGEVYNQYAYNFIANVYNLISEPKKFDIFEQVKDNFKSLSNIILNANVEELKFTENEKILKDKLMKLDFKTDLLLKRCYTDELGFSMFKTGNVEIKYNYFKPNDNTLEIRFEAPGNSKIGVTHKIIGDSTIITIKGTKKQDNTPKDLKENFVNLREFGDFELAIPLKVEEFKINAKTPKEGYPKFVNGVFIIQYELATNAETVSAEAKEEI